MTTPKLHCRYVLGLILSGAAAMVSLTQAADSPQLSGNPLFAGWYADPEGIIINNEYWIFPTYSAPYKKQLHLDAFSFMWSEGGWTGPNYSVAYAIADSPLGPFKRIAKVLQQDPDVATGAGHHSVIHDAQADIWYAIYHRRPLTETNANHRVTCIDRMTFDEKGFINPIRITHEGVPGRKLKQP